MGLLLRKMGLLKQELINVAPPDRTLLALYTALICSLPHEINLE
jgi:hypothetical protein